MHLGRRRERPWRKRVQTLHAAIKLRRGGEQAIVARARLGSDAIRHLALHHDHDHIELVMKFKEVQENVRCDVVRQVAHHAGARRLERTQVIQRSDGAVQDGAEIHLEHVGFDDLHVRLAGIAEAELRGQEPVKLDGDQPAGPAGQQLRERAFAGPDLHCHGLRHVTQGVHNFFRCAWVGQEILSQPGLFGYTQGSRFRCRHLEFSLTLYRALAVCYGGPMNIVFAASECVPFAKTGGLADVVGALPQALAELGHTVSVYLPKYKQTKVQDAKVLLRSVTVPFDDQYRFCSVLDGGKRAGVQFYFIDYPPFFDREALYGTPMGDYPDNAERFALYCRALLEASKVLGVPDIFHCHDWQSALVPILLRTSYEDDPVFR